MLYISWVIQGNDRTDQGLSLPVGLEKFGPYVLEIWTYTLLGKIYINCLEGPHVIHFMGYPGEVFRTSRAIFTCRSRTIWPIRFGDKELYIICK